MFNTLFVVVKKGNRKPKESNKITLTSIIYNTQCFEQVKVKTLGNVNADFLENQKLKKRMSWKGRDTVMPQRLLRMPGETNKAHVI